MNIYPRPLQFNFNAQYVFCKLLHCASFDSNSAINTHKWFSQQNEKVDLKFSGTCTWLYMYIFLKYEINKLVLNKDRHCHNFKVHNIINAIG